MAERQIKVFVSATADLAAEREVVGEVLARFPVPLPWRIERTVALDTIAEIAVKVQTSDIFILLLGQDISAPVGVELDAGIDKNLLLAFIKDVTRTPAGRFFQFNSLLNWHSFGDTESLRKALTIMLAQGLLDHSPGLGLNSDELALLFEYQKRAEKDTAKTTEAGITGHGKPAGADSSAVIVAR